MYTVIAKPPEGLGTLEQGWEYAADYFPHECNTLKEARGIAKLATEKGGQDVQIAKGALAPDTEPETVEVESDEKGYYPGVTVAFNTEYVAGLAIKKFGIANGVTSEMVYWTADGAGGDTEPKAKKALITAWHAIRAYMGDPQSPVPADELKYNGIASEAAWWQEVEANTKERMAEAAAEQAEHLADQPF